MKSNLPYSKVVKNIYTVFIMLIMLNSCSQSQKSDFEINVDVSRINSTMKGGMGASWHSISKEFPLDNKTYKYGDTHRGSAFGGNPPVEDTDAWRQVKDYASWLGLNFLRVELSQRMYEPERKKFDWDNEEMKALYLILDWCQQNEADVFLQQMWGYVAWNSYPDVHPLVSAPRNLDDFAEGIATLMEYLIKEKKYTCIKYFCMSNEPPGGTWGYWWEYGDEKGNIDDAWKRLKEEFDNRGIDVPISGPDWTDMPPFEEEKLTFAPYLGSIDIHSYQGVTEAGEANLKQWADWAHQQNKPFFLTEFGNMRLGWGKDNPGPKTFTAALSNANDIIRTLRAGADGLNRWSFTNKGNLDGQWQLIRTYNMENKEYYKKIEPENEAFYGFGILSRFLSKYSSVVESTTGCPDSVLMSIALLSPKEELSVFIVNLKDENVTVDFNIKAFPNKQMNVYQVTKESVNKPGFELNPLQNFNSSSGKYLLTLPAKSITTVSSYLLRHQDKGVF